MPPFLQRKENADVNEFGMLYLETVTQMGGSQTWLLIEFSDDLGMQMAHPY
jgi:hypothetical protein